ncbi:MAG: hypothetical protein IJB31_00890 [Akkermansia sp.]|nr:hypothetical protein [Akkermansia sp.]
MCDEFSPRLSAKELAKLAAARMADLKAAGESLHPVVNVSRKLATHFWGQAWMRHLAHCEAGGLCLAPGRTLLRHGCVLDVRLAPGLITAKVSADEIYEVSLRMAPPDDERVEALRHQCSGHIDSLVSLLAGKIDDSVMQQLCHPENGLLPEPADWHMFCSCADWAEPCPHAAAAIYAAGVLIDENPSLLFMLRSVDAASLVSTPVLTTQNFDASNLSSTFGIDIDI